MRKLQTIAAGWLIVVASATAQAGIVSHNGTVSSTPPGSGDVAVELSGVIDFPGLLLFGRTFFDDVTHVLEYAYDPPLSPPLILAEGDVNNPSGAAWGDFHIDLLGGADFLDASGIPIPDGVLLDEVLYFSFFSASGATVASAEIEREVVEGELIKSSLWIIFDIPVAPGGSFSMDYRVGGPLPGFTMEATPSPIAFIDTDGDGIADSLDNCPAIANPGQGDFAGDGDGDVCDADDDNDGLSDTDEAAWGTDPFNSDTDGDGLEDGDEVVFFGTDPLIFDTDGDCLSDGDEVAAGSDPLDPGSRPHWYDDFETYPLASQMHGQGGWAGWNDFVFFGALVTDSQALSAPHSVDIIGNADLLHDYAGATSCQWVYTAWQYVPYDFVGESYFILMNTHNGGATNWSTQVLFDSSSTGIVHSDYDGAELPLITGQWVELRVEIDLDADSQTFFYGGNELYTKSWTEGVSGGGAFNIGAVDLFANGASSVYYDNMSLLPVGVGSDADGDGLTDATELDMAEGSGCPDPNNADSDGDTISDGDEVTAGTSPCSSDTDGDGVPDNLDPDPLDPGMEGFIAAALRTCATTVADLDIALFDAPNDNARRGRRNATSNKLNAAANATSAEDFDDAFDQLTSLLAKLDGEPQPPDWMVPSPEKDDLRSEVELLKFLLEFL